MPIYIFDIFSEMTVEFRYGYDTYQNGSRLPAWIISRRMKYCLNIFTLTSSNLSMFCSILI